MASLSYIMATHAKDKSWKHARVEPWWSTHRDLPYVNEPFNDELALKEWRDLGYTQTKFTGDMYDMRNTRPPWIEPFRDHFPWRHFSWSVYRMAPGRVLPEHRDTYSKFAELHQVTDIESIYRAVVFLEDWQSGHYFEIDRSPVIKWQAGDCVIWQGSTPHLAANVGKTDRYTLQITGIPDENPLV